MAQSRHFRTLVPYATYQGSGIRDRYPINHGLVTNDQGDAWICTEIALTEQAADWSSGSGILECLPLILV